MISVKLVEVIQIKRSDNSNPLKANREVVELWTKDGTFIARYEQQIAGGKATTNPLIED